MHAAVLHTIGTVPRYEEFPEPAIGDKDREVIVHIHAASLKPVDKQMASGSHYASHSELPRVCGSDGTSAHNLNYFQKPTNQNLESQNVPTSLLTRINFELTVNRNPAQCR